MLEALPTVPEYVRVQSERVSLSSVDLAEERDLT
jgi:hypothetical protein